MAEMDHSVTIKVPSEIVVYMNHDISEYHGTRAMLEAEGIIPNDFEWPSGYESFRWSDDKNEYWLSRRRPDGEKGPRKLFINVDWWHFRWTPLGADDYVTRQLKRKAQDLAEYAYRNSPKGAAEFHASWTAYNELSKDQEFQKFMASIPGITKPERVRRANGAH